MMGDERVLTFKIRKNKKVFKEKYENIDFKSLNLSQYIAILKDLQKEVNEALTEMVGLESSDDASPDEEEECEEEDVGKQSPKRKYESKENVCKKTKS